MQQLPAQRPDLILPSRQAVWLQRTSSVLRERFRLRPGCDPEAQSLNRGSDYFFFFEVFFAAFLVAALAVFFAFFAFLAMWSSLILSLGRHAHAVHRHAHQRDDTIKA
jgi:hypothetical protein